MLGVRIREARNSGASTPAVSMAANIGLLHAGLLRTHDIEACINHGADLMKTKPNELDVTASVDVDCSGSQYTGAWDRE